MARRPTIRLLLALRRLLRNDQLVLALLAMAIGAAVGGGVIAFRSLLAVVQHGAFGFSSARVVTLAGQLPWWHVLLAPALGGLVVGILLRVLMRDGRPQGVAQVMEASALHGGRMSARTGLGAALVSAVSLGVGASAGREGPAVHLGATIGALVAHRLGFPAGLARTLLGCGAAAAVAASFNAPIAGVFFALEVVTGQYVLRTFAPIVIASVSATIATRVHYGDFPAFILPDALGLVSFWEFPAFALLGVVSAGVAMIFMWSIMVSEDIAERSRIPRLLRPAVGGLMVGAIAIEYPHVLGVGYEATDMALHAMLPLALLLTLAVLKTVATAISLGAGFGGGVFSPSLFIGAMTGGAFGIIATHAFPDLSSGHGAYTLIGMAAVSACVLGAPISTILIVFEMTNDHTLTIAVMAAVVISSTITEQTMGRSFFEWQLARRGVNLTSGRESLRLAGTRVSDIMKDDYALVPQDAGIDEVAERLRRARYGELFVVDGDSRLVGVIMLPDLASALSGKDSEKENPKALRAADIARSDPPVLQESDDVRRALELMDGSGESHIAVVRDKADRRLVGFVHEHDVMLAYHRALVDLRAEAREETKLPRRRRRRSRR